MILWIRLLFVKKTLWIVHFTKIYTIQKKRRKNAKRAMNRHESPQMLYFKAQNMIWITFQMFQHFCFLLGFAQDCQSVGTVNFAIPFTTSVTISISILQTFRSWVATSHLRLPMAFLSHSLSDTPGLAPLMNVLFWRRCDFPISFSGRDMSRNAWNRH